MSSEVHVQKGEFLLENWRTHCETGNHVTFLVSDEDLEPFKNATINKGKQVGQRYSFFLVEIGPDEQPVVPATPPPPKPPKPETKEAKAAREAAEFHAKTGDLLAGSSVVEQTTDNRQVDGSSPSPPTNVHESQVPIPGEPFVEQPDGSFARIGEAVVVPGPTITGDELPEEWKKHGFPTGLCGLAVKWCNDPHFCSWLEKEFPNAYAAAMVEPGSDEDRAKAVVCDVCMVTSRKELDTDHDAKEAFNALIREPYSQVREVDGVDDPDPF